MLAGSGTGGVPLFVPTLRGLPAFSKSDPIFGAVLTLVLVLLLRLGAIFEFVVLAPLSESEKLFIDFRDCAKGRLATENTTIKDSNRFITGLRCPLLQKLCQDEASRDYPVELAGAIESNWDQLSAKSREHET